MRKFILFMVFVCLLPNLARAYTGTITPPELKAGQFVYAFPEGFVPDGIGVAGLQHIQGVAKNLHHPFYVVLVDRLPGLTREQHQETREKGYRESGPELEAAYAIDRLAEDWAQMYPDIFDAAHSSIFLLSYNPRQYRMLAGVDWKVNLKLEKDALEPFANLFFRRVQGTPKDPAGGIIDLISAFDAHVFNLTDPAILAARAEAEAKRLREVALQEARGVLEEQILTLSNLLKSNPKYLPEDLSSYKDLLANAKDIRRADVPDKMQSFAASMKPVVEVLHDYVRQKVVDAFLHALLWVGIAVALLVFIAIISGVLIKRKRKLLFLRNSFMSQMFDWDKKIKNAAAHYVQAYGEREDVIALDDTQGETLELFKEVTKELDEIWGVVKALEDHISQCTKLAGKVTFFNFKPLMSALTKLGEEFEFDTGSINKFELFGKETQHIKITPQKAEKNLQERFQAVQETWDRLKKAAEFRNQEACKQFPHTTMDEIQQLAEKFGFPAAWYKDHPLAGNDDSDASVWKTADDLRWTDPVAYSRHIQKLQDTEAGVFGRIQELVTLATEVEGNRSVTDEMPPQGCTSVNPDDDPYVTLVAAKQADNAFRAALVSCAPDMDIEKVSVKADTANDLYRKVREQSASLKVALQVVDTEVRDLGTASSVAQKCLDEAFDCINRAKQTHAHALEGQHLADACRKIFLQAQKEHTEAQFLLDTKSHLMAYRKASNAKTLYNKVRQMADQVLAFIASMDRDRQTFEVRLGQMEAAYAGAIRKVQQYEGNSSSVDTYREPALKKGPVDYTAMLALLDAQIVRWHNVVDQTQRSYETEQARRRAEEERERRRRREEQEEADRRRRMASYSYHSSSRSSSSSSWGGGGSSGFGGGFGGGGSSSCGGGW